MSTYHEKRPGIAPRPLPTNLDATSSRPDSSGATLRLPVALADRLDQIEARLDAVEQLTICPMACARERCAFRCPLPEGGAQ